MTWKRRTKEHRRKSTANRVNWFEVVVTNDETTKFRESVQWLEQFYPCLKRMIETDRRILLLVGSESYLTEVWSMKNNYWKGTCYLEWKLDEDSE